MKVAALTVTRNDDYKLEQWVEYYKQYKDGIDYHIIIDNASSETYLNNIKKIFCDSIILERKENGGLTAAFNQGIEYVFQNTDADAILILVNDVKISKESIDILKTVLQSDSSYGMVSPLLLKKDSMIVEDFGNSISNELALIGYCVGMDIREVKEEIRLCDAVPGGVNLATVQFYKNVGLQDEKLFMYSDEVEIGIRAKKFGYKMVSVACAASWHQHVNPTAGGYRHPYSSYLMARNKVYIAKKNGMKKAVWEIVIKRGIRGVKQFITGCLKNNFAQREHGWYSLCGLYYGMKNDMTNNKYTQS